MFYTKKKIYLLGRFESGVTWRLLLETIAAVRGFRWVWQNTDRASTEILIFHLYFLFSFLGNSSFMDIGSIAPLQVICVFLMSDMPVRWKWNFKFPNCNFLLLDYNICPIFFL